MSSRRPSVLMTADAVGGVWTYALDLARGLDRFGVRLDLAVLGPAPSAEQRAQAGSVSGLELIETGLPLDWTAAEPAQVHQAGEAIAALAAARRADLVHLNSPALGADAAFEAPVVAVCHSCLATWWAAVKGAQPLPQDFAWRTELTGRAYGRADAVVAVSRSFAEATAAAYGLAQTPTTVLNGRAPVAATAGDEPAAPELFAFSAGRLWDEGKGARTLDDAAAAVGFPVIAAGPLTGPHGGVFAPAHLRSLGGISAGEVAGWLRRRPIFVSAGLYEPFGLAVLEAAQEGCPLVLSDIATFRELWDGAAVYVPPGDASALAATLERLGGDPGKRFRLGEAARERAARFTPAAMVAGMLDVYRVAAPGAFTRVLREAAA